MKQVKPLPKPQHVVQKPKLTTVGPEVEAMTQTVDAAPAVAPSKVDYVADLFDMLSMVDGPSENNSEAAAGDDNAWAGFQCML